MNHSQTWAERTCRPRTGPSGRLSAESVAEALRELPGWTREEDTLVRTFEFENYLETLTFVNAVAWIAHTQDHHPNLEMGYRTCVVRYSTHSVKGLSENDIICAARIDRLLATSGPPGSQ